MMNPSTSTPTDRIHLELWDASHTVAIHAHGKLTRADYDRHLPEMEAATKDWPVINFFIVLDDFHGWEAGAAWQDLKFDVRNGRRFGRAAIIGESAGERWGTKISDWLMPGDIRFFEPAQEGEARTWVTANP